MSLPPTDLEFLERRKLPHEIVTEAGMTCVVFPSWSLPSGLNSPHADLLLRLQAGYPDLPPDMWWVSPELFTAGGGRIQATEVVESHLGRSWQRWSRHLDAGLWKSGVDGLESYVALIDREFKRAAGVAA